MKQKNQLIIVTEIIGFRSQENLWVIESYSTLLEDIKNIQIITKSMLILDPSLISTTKDGELITPLKGKSMLLDIRNIIRSSKESSFDVFEGEAFLKIECSEVFIKKQKEYIRDFLSCFASEYEKLPTKYTKEEISFIFNLAWKLTDEKSSFSIEEIELITEMIQKWPYKAIV